LAGNNNYGESFMDGELEIGKENDIYENLEVPMTEEQRQHFVKMWGKSFEDEDYYNLEKFYTQLLGSYACDTPIQENLYKNIAKTQILSDKALVRNNVTEFKNLQGVLSGLLGDANIKPKNASAAQADGLQTYGMWIKHIENDEPIPEAQGEFKDPDRIKSYIETYFVKHFRQVFGLSDDMSNFNNPAVADIISVEEKSDG
jgi:hypothetical protein